MVRPCLKKNVVVSCELWKNSYGLWAMRKLKVVWLNSCPSEKLLSASLTYEQILHFIHSSPIQHSPSLTYERTRLFFFFFLLADLRLLTPNPRVLRRSSARGGARTRPPARVASKLVPTHAVVVLITSGRWLVFRAKFHPTAVEKHP